MFEPEIALDFVTKMFEPLVEAKNISLSLQIYDFLHMPEDLQEEKQAGIVQTFDSGLERQNAKLPTYLLGDERRFKQVIINLVKNAKKFTEEGGIKIKVSYNESNSSLVVHVEDTGVGIAERDLTKLFNKFGKLERTAMQNAEGIGLGLTIVK